MRYINKHRGPVAMNGLFRPRDRFHYLGSLEGWRAQRAGRLAPGEGSINSWLMMDSMNFVCWFNCGLGNEFGKFFGRFCLEGF